MVGMAAGATSSRATSTTLVSDPSERSRTSAATPPPTKGTPLGDDVPAEAPGVREQRSAPRRAGRTSVLKQAPLHS